MFLKLIWESLHIQTYSSLLKKRIYNYENMNSISSNSSYVLGVNISIDQDDPTGDLLKSVWHLKEFWIYGGSIVMQICSEYLYLPLHDPLDVGDF